MRRLSGMLGIAAAIAASLTLAALPAAPSFASGQTAPPDDAPVTWSVRPGDANGPDGRAWIEWEADPGQLRTEHLVVSNHGQRDVEFRLSAADGYFTEKGRFTTLPPGRESTGAGTWIRLPAAVTVAAGGSEIVPFTIAVPSDATPGDHPAGVAASILAPGGDSVRVESRVGFRVMTRVTGELRAGLSAGISGSYAGSINPFETGRLDVSYHVTNTGNTRVRTQPEVSVTGPFGLAASEHRGEEIAEIAPGETRTGTISIPSAWPLLWYDVRVEAVPVAVADELAIGEVTPTTASASIAAVPLPQILTVMIGALLLAWSVWQRRRRRARTEQLVAAARAEGRAEAAGSGPSPAEPALRRRNRMPAGLAVASLLLGAAALAGVHGAAPARAAEPAVGPVPAGLTLEVEIPPRPTPLPSATPDPSPSTAVTHPPAGPPSDGHDDPLPPTGGGADGALALVGAVLLAAGLTAVAARAARRRRRSVRP